MSNFTHVKELPLIPMNKLNRPAIMLSLAAILVVGVVAALTLIAASQSTQAASAATPRTFNNSQGTTTANPLMSFRMEAWADNWFAAYLDEDLLIEDSVPITTERSFNAETVSFKARYPLHLNFILKDYKANDTGLEYIGAFNQQMGDGGFIMQVTDLATNAVVGVSDATWQCLVIHQAPLDKACASSKNPVAGTPPCDFKAIDEPKGWKTATFDASSWPAASVFTSAEVQPKDGYDKIRWDSRAKLIWGPDLKADNTVLCRMTIAGGGK